MNVRYVKNILANCDGNMYLPNLHVQRVELRCKMPNIYLIYSRPFAGVKLFVPISC